MKKIFLAFALISGIMVAQAQTTTSAEKKGANGPKMEFKTSLNLNLSRALLNNI